MKKPIYSKQTSLFLTMSLILFSSIAPANSESGSQHMLRESARKVLDNEITCSWKKSLGLPDQARLLQDFLQEDVKVKYPRTVVDDKKIYELRSFYSAPDLEVDTDQELSAHNSTAATEITEDKLQEIFPNSCDTLIDQVADTVKMSVAKSSTLLLASDQGGPRDIAQACPRWDTLSQDDKRDFYIAIVTAIAMAESTCNNKAVNPKATNGTAYGYFQSTRRLSPQKGAEWVVKQIDRQVRQSGLLFWPDSNKNYWAVLNPNIHSYKVKRLLKKIPACAVDAVVQRYSTVQN